jgi:hypothetical protein
MIPKLGDQLEDLLDLRFYIRFILAVQGVMDTGFNMMLENIFLHFMKGTNNGAKLDKDIDAVALVLDHLLDAPHLPFYAV